MCGVNTHMYPWIQMWEEEEKPTKHASKNKVKLKHVEFPLTPHILVTPLRSIGLVFTLAKLHSARIPEIYGMYQRYLYFIN